MDIRAEQYRDAGQAHAGPRERTTARHSLPLRVLAPLLVLAIAVGAFIALSSTAKKPERSTDEPLPIAVEIVPVRSVKTNLRVTAQGEVRSKTEADIAARVSGQIVYVAPRFEAGAAVKTGDVIARIDPAEYMLAVERARSQVSRARENLARVRSEAALAEGDWRELGMKGDPSDLTLQKPQVASATADLRTAEAFVREAELSLQRTEIVAPFDGRVKTRRIDVGDFVVAGAPVASLFAIDVAQVRVPLTDYDLGVLGVAPGFAATERDPGPAASVRGAGAGANQVWTGYLTLVEASFEAATRLVYGLVEVKDPFATTAPLAPGMYVSVELKGRTEDNFRAVPRGAFKKNEIVYTVGTDGAIRGRRLTPAHATAEDVFFREGIEAGERVVVSYLPSPRDGMKVRDVKDPPPPKIEDAPPKKGKKARADKTDTRKPESE